MLNKLLTLILFFLPALALSAQTAAEMDTLLQAEAVSVAVAARFILGSADLLPSGVSGSAAERAAYDMAKSNGWVRKEAADNITLKDTAFLVMRAFDFNGGVLYRIFRNPRYAYREMQYRKIIQGRAYSNMTVSGNRLLHIVGRAMSYSEEISSAARETQ